MQKVSQSQMKHLNALAVFRLIQSHNDISRAAIAKITKLSPTSISTIVDSLIHKGLVAEHAPLATKGVGRKAIRLEVNDNEKGTIGMELGHDGVSGSVFTLKHEPVVTIREPFKPSLDLADELPSAILRVLRLLIDAARRRFRELLGVCIGVPAVLDVDKKSIVFSSPFNVKNIDLFRMLRQQIECPLWIENETLLSATVERSAQEKQADRFIYLSVNDGLGVCVMIDGKHMQGAEGIFPEIGHMSLHLDGPPCVCGNRGCFERYVSVPAFVQHVQDRLRNNSSSLLYELSGGDVSRIDPEMVSRAAGRNDMLAKQAIRHTGEVLGSGIINLIHLFQPELIVIGGKLSLLGTDLLEAVEHRVQERAITAFAGRCTIALSPFRTSGSISIGASMHSLDCALENLL